MPKKAAAKAKSEPKETESAGPDEKVILQRKQESLKHQLAIQSNVSADAEHQMRDMRQKLLDTFAAFEQEKKAHFEVITDMTRQYKTMREELLTKINALEEKNLQFQSQLERARLDAEESERKKKQVIALKDAEIAEYKQKMDDMAVEFSQMLKATLDKMSEKITVTSDLLSNRRIDDM